MRKALSIFFYEERNGFEYNIFRDLKSSRIDRKYVRKIYGY